jgi:phospholipid-translocating ATPase
MAVGGSETSNPVKRIRWATQRVQGKKGVEKRKSIFRRNNARNSATEKRMSGNTDEPDVSKPAQQSPDAEAPVDEESGRTIYFNIPLPDSAKDDEGRPLQHYTRNKIRTAKYTALSFIPKNLWFQFHNIANVYFLAIIILSVCIPVIGIEGVS